MSTTISEDDPDIPPHVLSDIIFPFDNPYPAQSDGIERTIQTLQGESGGYVALEGACGTGKTLLSLVAGLSLVRSSTTPYKRIVVATSVKQQQQAFENDLDSINENLSQLSPSKINVPAEFVDPVTSVTLVGKADVCPYKSTSHIEKSNIYSACSTLQSKTKALINNYDNNHDKIKAAGKLSNDARKLADRPLPDSRLITDPETHPYPDTPPTMQSIPYCPYYSQTQLNRLADEPAINHEGEVLTKERLGNRALEQGTCPYEAMKDVTPQCEVILANYTHILDSRTSQSYAEILDGNTLIIFDEAHMLPAKARNSFTRSVTMSDIEKSIDEITQLLDWANRGGSVAKEITDAIGQARTTLPDIRAFKNFLCDYLEVAETAIKSHQAFRHNDSISLSDLESWGNKMKRPETLPLRDPSKEEKDTITASMRMYGHDLDGDATPTALYGENIGNAVSHAYTKAAKESQSISRPKSIATEAVGPFIKQYFAQNHRDYFRHMRVLPIDHRRAFSIEGNPTHSFNFPNPIEITVKNCMPASGLANQVFRRFGGGICMSATIEPIGVFTKEAGMSLLSLEDKFDQTRKPYEVEELQYGLQFPTSNRKTITVDLPKYTYANRNISKTDPEQEVKRKKKVQDQYYQSVKAVVTNTPGNVLVAGPSYATTGDIADRLNQDPDVNKPVLKDQSSSNNETTALRRKFTKGEPKVLATGMRGTLTEGVDFSGDDCLAVAAFGVPISNTTTKTAEATKFAYNEHFKTDESSSNKGYRYAFAIPAIRKARQAIGRVIRSTEDVGTRVLIDERYTPNGELFHYLSDDEKEEVHTTATPQELESEIQSFWEKR